MRTFCSSELTFEAGFGFGTAGNPLGSILRSNGPSLTLEILVSCGPALFPASTLCTGGIILTYPGNYRREIPCRIPCGIPWGIARRSPGGPRVHMNKSRHYKFRGKKVAPQAFSQQSRGLFGRVWGYFAGVLGWLTASRS